MTRQPGQPRYSSEDIDEMLDQFADKLGNYTLAEAHLRGLGILASTQESAQEDIWQHTWTPGTPQELHAAKTTADARAAFGNAGISIRAKRAKYEDIRRFRAAAMRDKDALQEAASVADFCEPAAMDAIERHIVGNALVTTLRMDPDKRFSREDTAKYLEQAGRDIAACADEDEFMAYAHAAQDGHAARFDYWLALTRELETNYPFLKQVS